jgi:hypothetical protein
MVGFADLLYLSAALSPDENPYFAVSQVLKGYLIPQVPRSAVIQLYLLVAVHGLYVPSPLFPHPAPVVADDSQWMLTGSLYSSRRVC